MHPHRQYSHVRRKGTELRLGHQYSHSQRIQALAAEVGGPLAGGGGSIAQIAVHQAGAVLSIEQTADCAQ